MGKFNDPIRGTHIMEMESKRIKVRHILIVLLLWTALSSPANAEMYKWVDEQGTVHFTDDASKIPEKYRPDAELRKIPKPMSSPEMTEVKEKSVSTPSLKNSKSEGIEVDLLRRHELLLSEVVLNGKVKRYFIVDTGASFTLINGETAKELGFTINESTPFIPVSTVSSIILVPLVTLKSVQVGGAEAGNVDALIYTMPSGQEGLLGNSYLNRFKVVLDSIRGKMTLFPFQGKPSPDRPGGFGRDYWAGQFRFYHRNLEELKKLKAKYEGRGASSELNRVNNGIRYFGNQLNELERKASLAGVPRNWRE